MNDLTNEIKSNARKSFTLEKYPEFGINYKQHFIPFASYIQKLNKDPKNKAFIHVYKNFTSRIDPKFLYLMLTPVEKDCTAEGTIKIQIKINSIESISINYNDDNGSFLSTFFVKLKQTPKVFMIIKNTEENAKKIEGMKKETYFNSFKSVYDMFEYTNHYHITTEERNESNGKVFTLNEFIKKFHPKNESKIKKEEKQSAKEEKEFIGENVNCSEDDNSNNDIKDFVRLDSFLCKENEFLNFYLLNLILKFKINFSSSTELEQFITTLGLANIVSNSEKDKIQYISEEKFLLLQQQLKHKTIRFYKYFLNLHFTTQYSLLSLITQKRLNILSFDENIVKYLSLLSCEDQDKAALVLDEMNKNTTLTQDILNTSLLESFKKNYSDYVQNKELNTINEDREHLTITRTIEVTPSMIFYVAPKFERTNHLLRKYSDYKENFLKMNIFDEDKNKLYFSSFAAMKLSKFISELMHEGLYIGSRYFQFISSSNSQMKNCSFWLVNLEGTKFEKRENIIMELGDFTEEKNIYKNAARRGQCLSSTTFITMLNKEKIIEIDDIKRNGFIFTDGIGQISPELSIKCATVMKYKQNFSSAYQIRLGGVKGVVAVNPSLKGETLCVRPSMIKFKSDDLELGVVRGATYSLGYLNRQIIILLYSLGVKGSIFLNMVKDIMNNYNRIMIDPFKVFKSNKDILDDILTKCYYFTPFIRYYVYNKTFHIKSEPFACSILYNIICALIQELKHKGKIVDNQSASLIGVIDETNTLEQNEVYVNIKNNEELILSGEVFVTKNPCLHPGDIKILKAKGKCPQLSHLINVIVFSAKGDRPMPNMIGGGDLDGDTYYVSWNQEIIRSIKIRNVPSLDDPNYSGNVFQKEKAVNKTFITMEDITNTYLDASKNSHVPLISNLHSAFADEDLEKGAFNEKCLLLSQLFSVEIDSAKHGKFIDPNIFKEKGLELNAYPDFLNIENFPSYESKGILGQLYRSIDKSYVLSEYDKHDSRANYYQEYDIDINLVTYGSINYALDALEIYAKYQNDILGIMKMFNCNCESEIFLCENIHNKRIAKFNKNNDTFVQLNLMKNKYTKMIQNMFNNNITKDIASAIYLVTYLNNRSISKYPDFFGDDLGKKLIANMNNYGIISSRPYSKENRPIKKRIFSLPWFIKEVRDVLLNRKK